MSDPEMVAAGPVRLADYKPWPFDLPTVDLDVQIQTDYVVVTSHLSLEPRQAASPLLLQGVDLELLSIAIDGAALSASEWTIDQSTLRIDQPPERALKQHKK